MSEDKLFSAGIYEVTRDFIIEGATRFMPSHVTNVSDFSMGPDIKGVLFYAVIIVACIAYIFDGGPGLVGILVSVAILLGFGYLIYRQFAAPTCVVVVGFQNGHEIKFSSSDKR